MSPSALALPATLPAPPMSPLDALDEWQRGGPRYLRTEPLGPHIQLIAYEHQPRAVAGIGEVAVPVVVAWGVGRGTSAALSDLAERGARLGVW